MSGPASADRPSPKFLPSADGSLPFGNMDCRGAEQPLGQQTGQQQVRVGSDDQVCLLLGSIALMLLLNLKLLFEEVVLGRQLCPEALAITEL